MNKYVVWLHRVTFVGVLINILGMALPFIFAPQWYPDFFGLPGPGGRDPVRYRIANARAA